MSIWGKANLLRARDGHEAKVLSVELFFDLVYVFAVTQLSHHLLENLTPLGALQTLVLWFAVWLVWQYTCWVTNWFDPDTLPIRLMLFAVMLVGLVMSAVLPDAFGERGMIFAVCYAVMQIGRTLFVVFHLGSSHALSKNFQRMLGWLCISGALWIAGGWSSAEYRLLFWIAAVACEYFSPMIGLWLPGMGRSKTQEWTIEGGHMAERCQLFVIVALGESILVTGATIGHMASWETPTLIAFLVAFLGSLAMWWIYFDTSSQAGTEAIVNSNDPGRIGAYFHYTHVIIVAGVIITAVGNELAIAHPAGHIDTKSLAVLIGGPMVYLLGNGIYKTVVYRRFPFSHMIGLGLLAVLIPFAYLTDQLMISGLTTVILIAAAIQESVSRRGQHAASHAE
ncbi:low temperature requirement protein A [Collimonas pratensis]|uniref:Bacterial low temperature requirement A family protein n=1 Tax=Collimonas pratensis TaxID=279113 RepID=A0ABM5Z7P0_9BURK|nr:low temperature requirement protein A [Collimonas pratensis]AMP15066.1 bacterial low temperature requirement A family protein [Collimonas pratensis]